MAKTGGQAVEEDLGGWLLAITIGLIVIVVLLVSDIITGILTMFGGSGVGGVFTSYRQCCTMLFVQHIALRYFYAT